MRHICGCIFENFDNSEPYQISFMKVTILLSIYSPENPFEFYASELHTTLVWDIFYDCHNLRHGTYCCVSQMTWNFGLHIFEPTFIVDDEDGLCLFGQRIHFTMCVIGCMVTVHKYSRPQFEWVTHHNSLGHIAVYHRRLDILGCTSSTPHLKLMMRVVCVYLAKGSTSLYV